MKTIIIIVLAILSVVFLALIIYFGTKNGGNDVTLWGNWESCSACYGTGTQQRFRFCTEEEKLDVCPHGWIKETQDCYSDDKDSCPENALDSKWSSWVPCNCRIGEQFRLRLCTNIERKNTSFCPHGFLKETKKCYAQCPSASVCYGEYTTFSDSYRRESISAPPYNCDRDKIDGMLWYRFNLTTGENGVLDHCPEMYTCGTHWPIWMNDTHPTQYGVIHEVRMAGSTRGHSTNSNCFWASGLSALVTKCAVNGEVFFLYKLWKPTLCNVSYCTRKHDI